GGTALTNTGYDVFVAKLDATGNWLWARKAGGTGTYVDELHQSFGLAVDRSNNCYVAAPFASTPTLGGTPLTNAGASDVFVGKLDGSGNWLWVRSGGGAGYEYASSLAVDASDNVLMAGTFNGTNATFGGAVVTNTGFSYQAYVAKLDNGGNWLWARSGGGPNADYGYGTAVDVSENVYLAGEFQGEANFGGTVLTNTGYSGGFIAE